MSIVFIKKDYIVAEDKKRFLNEILIFSISFFILSFIFYGIILFQQSLVEREIAEIQEEITRIEATRDKNKERAILDFSDRITRLSELLKSRIYISKFTKALEKTILPQVVYSDFSLDIEKQNFEIRGQAASYGILAKQMFALEGAPVFLNVRLQNTIVQLGGVNFSFQGILDPNYLK